MKKQTKVKPVLAPDLRKDWKQDATNEIELLQDDIDMMELPEEKAKELESLIKNFKERLLDSISLFEVSTEIAFDTKDLFENMLDEIYYERVTAGEYEMERMIDITSESGVFIKINSLAQQIRVDEFVSELSENPYQLKLIA